jgi:flagellar protein FlaG
MVNEVTPTTASVPKLASVTVAPVAAKAATAAKSVETPSDTPRQENVESGGNSFPLDRANEQNNADSDKDKLEAAVKSIEEHVFSMERELEFRVDDDSGRMVVTVMDPATDEVVRQIPSEEALQIAQAIADQRDGVSSGVLVQTKA